MASVVITTPVVRAPKHIKVDGHHIHLRLAQSVIWALITTSLAVAVVAALYYLITQNGLVKPHWDNLFSYSWWPNYRHGLRDFGEPVLAAMAIHSLIASSWKRHPDQRLDGRALAWAITKTLVLAFGIIILGVYLIDYVLAHTLAHITAAASGGVQGNVLSGLNWEAFVFSFIAVHLIRKVWQPVGNTISLQFTEQAVAHAKGRTPLWVRLPLAPPSMRERFAYIQQTHPDVKPKRDFATRLLMILVALSVPLAGYGEYVLHVIAKGK